MAKVQPRIQIHLHDAKWLIFRVHDHDRRLGDDAACGATFGCSAYESTLAVLTTSEHSVLVNSPGFHMYAQLTQLGSQLKKRL